MSVTKAFLFLFFVTLTLQTIADLRKNLLGIPDECKYHDRIHWVFALDKSGSMKWDTPTRWTSLKQLMNQPGGLIDSLDHTNDFMSAFTFRWNVDPNLVVHSNVPTGYTISFTDPPAGGTNFANALDRAIDIFQDYMNQNSCFIMITDGESFYPEAQVNELNALFAGIEEETECKTCARCYFIKGTPETQIPEAYERLCKGIGAHIISETPEYFESKFALDFQEFRKSI